MNNRPNINVTIKRGTRTGKWVAAGALPGGTVAKSGNTIDAAKAHIRVIIPLCYDVTYTVIQGNTNALSV